VECLILAGLRELMRPVLYVYICVFLNDPICRTSSHSQCSDKASLKCVSVGVFLHFPIGKNSCHIESGNKASLLCPDERNLPHSQKRSQASLTPERNSFQSQSRSKASLLCVYVHVVLRCPGERNSFHSQGRRLLSCVYAFMLF
jgi:hypothetical protein